MNLTFTSTSAMLRTPAKNDACSPGSGGSPRSSEKAGPSPPSVRRSIGEWEAGKSEPQAKSPANPKRDATPPATSTLEARRRARVPVGTEKPPKRPESNYLNRTAEARACLNKAKLHLNNSRNLKTEIKTEVVSAVDRLFELVKESERSKVYVTPAPAVAPAVQPAAAPIILNNDPMPTSGEPTALMMQLMENLQQHNEALEKCQLHTLALSEHLKQVPRFVAGQGPSFAEMAAAPKRHFQEPLHSVIVSSVDDKDTGEEVLEKLRTAVDARNEGTRVERVRKARDQKVVVGFRTREELTKVTERIKKAGNLMVEEVKNKNPLIIAKDVLSCHSDEEFIDALKRQNSHLIGDVTADDLRMGVKYRRRTRNPHMCHVVLQVSPAVWQRLTHAGRVHIDMQRVRVLDQSPLIQCTRCLRFGHSRKLCTESADLCTHCGDPHMRVDCPSRLAAEPPKCRNCVSAKMGKTEHNAFDSECPTRLKWDGLARLSVAYC